MTSTILDPILAHPPFRAAVVKSSENLCFTGVYGSMVAGLMAVIDQHHTNTGILVICESLQQAEILQKDLRVFAKERLLHFPAWEVLPEEEMEPHSDLIAARMSCLHQLVEQDGRALVVTSRQAIAHPTIEPELLYDHLIEMKVGQRRDMQEFLKELVAAGYQRMDVVADKGEFSVRGGIVDVYGIGQDDPFRIEFWDDEVESLRCFDVVSQKSVQRLDEIHLYPLNC